MSVSHCSLLGLALCLLLVVHGIDAQMTDPCNLPPNVGANWFGPPSRVKSCFDNIPFNSTIRESTMAIMERVFALYSFSDIATAGLEPYYLQVRLGPLFFVFSSVIGLMLTITSSFQVDWPALLRAIGSNPNYHSDFEFHNGMCVCPFPIVFSPFVAAFCSHIA